MTLNGDGAWRRLLACVQLYGHETAPRGQPTIEVLHLNNLVVDLARAVVTQPERNLNHRFMVAEALWILDGDNQLAPLTRFVKRMADYSDDGTTLAGAYGPRVVPQLPYVVEALQKDLDTRQAVLTIWERCPAPSKDIPCTIAMVFSVRRGRLHQHVFMRSSDVWLGIPYDMCSFSCVGIKVACLLNQTGAHPPVRLGQLTITAASSHLYLRDLDAAKKVLLALPERGVGPVPDHWVQAGTWDKVETALLRIRDESAPLTALWGAEEDDDVVGHA